MSFCCECCVLSGRGLCDELITCPEESYRLWCVVECDLETSSITWPWPTGGCCVKQKIQPKLYAVPRVQSVVHQLLAHIHRAGSGVALSVW